MQEEEEAGKRGMTLTLEDLLSRSRTHDNRPFTNRDQVPTESQHYGHHRTSKSTSNHGLPLGNRQDNGKMDPEDEKRGQVWGMPDFYETVGQEVGLGVKVVSLPQVSGTFDRHAVRLWVVKVAIRC